MHTYKCLRFEISVSFTHMYVCVHASVCSCLCLHLCLCERVCAHARTHVCTLIPMLLIYSIDNAVYLLNGIITRIIRWLFWKYQILICRYQTMISLKLDQNIMGRWINHATEVTLDAVSWHSRIPTHCKHVHLLLYACTCVCMRACVRVFGFFCLHVCVFCDWWLHLWCFCWRVENWHAYMHTHTHTNTCVWICIAESPSATAAYAALYLCWRVESLVTSNELLHKRWQVYILCI